MQRLLHRVGPWLFVLAIAWYLVGNYLIKTLEQQSLARATSLHEKLQAFDVGALGTVVIHVSGESHFLRGIQIRFDPGAEQAVVRNENLTVSVNGQTVDGALHITVHGAVRNRHESWGKLSLVLPEKTHRVGFAGETSFEVSGKFADPKSTLVLETMTCNSKLEVDDLSVNRLKLLSSCQDASDRPERCCNTSFTVEKGAMVERLEVSMASGVLAFEANSVPQTELYLGESVVVSGRRAFLEAAHFGKPVQ